MLAEKGGFIGKNEEYGIKKEQIREVDLVDPVHSNYCQSSFA
jgi:hypothetical protein